jgi:hypothetical protein
MREEEDIIRLRRQRKKQAEIIKSKMKDTETVM